VVSSSSVTCHVVWRLAGALHECKDSVCVNQSSADGFPDVSARKEASRETPAAAAFRTGARHDLVRRSCSCVSSGLLVTSTRPASPGYAFRDCSRCGRTFRW
jgi:hypothetical protein